MSRLEKILEEHSTLMVSKSNCGFCEESEKLFRKHGVKPYVVKFEDHPRDEMSDIIQELRKEKGHTTFPAIFYEGKFIGGYDQLKAFYDKENSKNI